MTERLQDRVAIITGGAGFIGAQITQRFCREGARVVVADCDTTKVNDIVQGLDLADPSRVTPFPVDARDDHQVQGMVAKVMGDFGRVDILVATVGGSKDALIHKMTNEQWDHVVEINLRTAFFSCRAVVPHMMERRYGKIVLMSSRSSFGNIGQANYSAAKAGIIGLTRSLAREMARYRVHVNCVVPGFIGNARTALMPEEHRQKRIALNPFQEIPPPGEVADVILFLASDEARQITGQAINVASW